MMWAWFIAGSFALIFDAIFASTALGGVGKDGVKVNINSVICFSVVTLGCYGLAYLSR